MNILVLIGEIAYISRRRIIDGLVSSAKKDGNNVVLFTCEGFLFHNLKNYIDGEYNIFKLPHIERYDGIIVDFNSIQNLEIRDYLRDYIGKCNIPCVSFDDSIPGCGVINFKTERAFESVVEHLISEHDKKVIHYLSGPMGNSDSALRKRAYEGVMRRHELPVLDEYIHIGDFNFGSGRALAAKLVESGKPLPDAIVAANDYMAIGLLEEFKDRGINIPEDIAIAGCDNCDLIAGTNPRLTTVDRGETEAGKISYELLMNMIKDDKYADRVVEIAGIPVWGESCGCNQAPVDKGKAKSYVDLSVQMDTSLDLIKDFTIMLNNVSTILEFEHKLAKFISKAGMEYFYYCQCGSRESYYDELETLARGEKLERKLDEYQDEVWCPIAYEKGAWKSFPSFDISLLFPPESNRDKGGIFYIVMPVHTGTECMGYGIIGNFDNELSGRVLQHIVLGIGKVLGNIRQNDITKTMLARINRKWQYDELTRLYNRSGMVDRVLEILKIANEKERGVAVYFFDLNGLKIVNDTKGHEEGDRYIQTMADQIRENISDGEIAVRFGGDEFVVICLEDSFDAASERCKILDNNINKAVSTSIGFSYGRPENMKDIQSLIRSADKKMYADKMRRKAER